MGFSFVSYEPLSLGVHWGGGGGGMLQLFSNAWALAWGPGSYP